MTLSHGKRTPQEILFFAIAVTESTIGAFMFGDFMQSGRRSVASQVPRIQISSGVLRQRFLIFCVGRIFFSIRRCIGDFQRTTVLLGIFSMLSVNFGKILGRLWYYHLKQRKQRNKP